MFRLTGAVCLCRAPALLVPVFQRERENVPYVYILDRNLQIKAFIPWLNAGEYPSVDAQDFPPLPTELKSRKVGDPALFICKFNEVFFVGESSELRRAYDHHSVAIEGSLLDVQLATMLRTPLSRSYKKFRRFAGRVFGRSASSTLYVRSATALVQNDEAIWNSIDRHERRFVTDADAQLRQILALGKEGLLEWLVENQFVNDLWPAVWLAGEARFGLEERFEALGVDWLSLTDEWWFFDRVGVNVFKRLLSEYRLRKVSPPFEFVDMLVRLTGETEIFTSAAALGPDEYFAIYRILISADKLDAAEKVALVAYILGRVPFEAEYISVYLGTLAAELRSVDLDRRPQLRDVIIRNVRDNSRLTRYRRFPRIRSDLNSIAMRLGDDTEAGA